MRSTKLNELQEDGLVQRFEALALEQDDAELSDDIAQVNRLFDRLEEVEAELKRRSGDRRSVLLRLYSHQNVHVRLKAAKATLAVAPEAARQMLKTIAESREYPQAGEAGMTIRALERGIFKPT
jgi:hypothetical protein